MTALRIAIACKAFVVGLSLCSVLGCSGFTFITAPTESWITGTRWVGPYDDDTGRGNGTLTMELAASFDSKGRLHGTWAMRFPDAARNLSGSVLAELHTYLSDDLKLRLVDPRFGPDCHMMLLARARQAPPSRGPQGTIVGVINAGVNLCDAAGTKRDIAISLRQE